MTTHQPRPGSLDNTSVGRWAAKTMREMYGATQSDIAEDARISQSKLSLYESGFVDLTEKELQRLKKALNALATDNDFSLEPLPGPATGLLSEMPGLALNDGTFAERYASWSKKKQIRARQSMRRQAQLTQIEVARELGITPKKLGHWEAGRLELSEAAIARWRQVIVAATVKQKKADPWARLEIRIEDAAHTALQSHKGQVLDDPLIAEIIASLRREIEALEEQAEATPATLDPHKESEQ
jgi:transcriptional regulator with XRE-family HTH domain